MFRRILLLAGIIGSTVVAYSTVSCSSSNTISACTTTSLYLRTNDAGCSDDVRRNLIAGSLALVGGLGSVGRAAAEVQQAPTTEDEGVILYKTPSGLKYIELEPGRASEPTPRYGQICIISYDAYLKLPTDKEKQKFDSYTSFLVKHGNGRMIAGLDEGLHTMRPGGLRRIIIPPKLGFVQSGLGPLPQYPWDRRKLSNLLDKMVEQRGGNLVYDVRLERVIDNEADQGYYEDSELSPEQLEQLQDRLMRGRGGPQG